MRTFLLVGYLFCLLALHASCSSDDVDVEALIAASKPKPIKVYERTPKAQQFLNSDALKSTPCLFQQEATSIALSKESEESFKSSFLNLVLYGNMVELVRDSRNEKASKIESKINLRKFFRQIDEYALETTMKFSLPTQLRLTMDLPSQLDDASLETRFESLEMQVLLNYENYSPADQSQFDQLICSMKLKTSVWLADSDKLKNKKESYEAALNPGQCLFVPNGWLVSFKTAEAWLLSIKWQGSSEPVPKAEDSQEAVPSRKLVGLVFKQDMGAPFYVFINHLVNSFANPETGLEEKPLNKTAFTEKIKTDQVINMGVMNWDQKATDLINKLFKLLDVNRDGLFGLDDFEDLDQISAGQLNDKIKAIGDQFLKLQEEQVELLKKLIEEWKAKTPELDMRKQLAAIFKVKINEWYEKLSDKEKEELKAKEIDMDILIDQLLDTTMTNKGEGGLSDEEAREQLKEKLIKENKERQKQRESSGGSGDNSMFDDEKPASGVKSTEEEIDEIFADEDDDGDEEDEDEDDKKSKPQKGEL